ncbi:TnsD family Tn7-like transposition protein [Paraburkholderia phenoliruptrix]|uniref:TnsD family Tn7-like transposition protein n=1 Tax=Paraburkholderia phenoliruptrix TaxID=252970 RepID=UPI0034CFD7BF
MDELLGTLIVEYMAEERVAHRYAFLRSLLGCQVSSLVAMPGGLQRLSNQTSDYWEMTATEIAENLTLMPYFVASSSPRVSRNVLAAMTQYSARIRNRGGLGFGRFSDVETLRYCRQCIRDDVESGRRPYFRRVHQLPGVAVCPKHETLLTCSELRAATLHAHGASGIASAFKGGKEVAIGPGGSSRMAAIFEMAKKSEEILRNAEPSEYFDVRLRYRHCLEGMGYTYPGGNCRLDELSADIVDYFGESFLRWLGLFREGQAARDWLVPLLCQGQAVAPTVAHVLLQQFVALARPNTRRLADKSVIRCPCSASEHEAGRFRGDLAWQGENSGNAKCICGSSFRFHLDGHVSTADRIWRYSDCYRDFAIQQAEKGRGAQEIAAELGVNAMTVRRFCGRDCSARGDQIRVSTSFDVQRARQEWLEAVERFGSLALARRMTRKTYRALLTYDREWLDSHRRNAARSFSLRVDWALRDSTYVITLRATAAAIRSEMPPRWVSGISILMVAEVPRGTRNQLEKLPKCSALLREVVETRQQFRERKKLADIEVVRSIDTVGLSSGFNGKE